ncbi:hypothetical protein ACJ41O_005861 [Fusarium nematophilum]
MASEVLSFSASSTSTSKREPSKRDSLHAAGSVFFISSTGRVLKLPIPSTSHRDPLTWSPSKRAFAFIALQLYSIAASVELNLPGFLVKAIQKEFAHDDIAPFSVQTLSSAMTLFVGIGYLIGVPLSKAVGRRPVLLGSAFVTTVSTIWAGLAGDFHQLLIAIGLQGLACGGAIGMIILILIDATFIHERPNALSLYWCSGAVFIKLSLIILPLTTDLDTNWRSVYQGWAVPCLTALVLALIFIPETYFLRPPVALDGRILVQSSSEKVKIYDDWHDVEAGAERPLPELPATRNPLSRLKVSRAPGTSWAAMAATYKQMLLCILNPLTFWVSLLSGVILSGVIYLNLAQPSVLVVRWGQDPEAVSRLSGVAGIVGSFVALATGPLVCWLTRSCSLRAGGVRHAEVYLPIFAMPVVSGLLSIILNAFAIEEDWAPIWMYITSALSLFSYLTGNVAFTLWITEAFPRWAAAALAVQLFVSNMASFGIGTAIMPWVETKTIVQPTVVISVLILILGVLAVPAAFWGKNVRQFIHGRWSDSEKGALRPQ